MQNVSQVVTGSIKAEIQAQKYITTTGLSMINLIQQFKQFVALAEPRFLRTKCMLVSVLETVLYSDLYFLLGTSCVTDSAAR